MSTFSEAEKVPFWPGFGDLLVPDGTSRTPADDACQPDPARIRPVGENPFLWHFGQNGQNGDFCVKNAKVRGGIDCVLTFWPKTAKMGALGGIRLVNYGFLRQKSQKRYFRGFCRWPFAPRRRKSVRCRQKFRSHDVRNFLIAFAGSLIHKRGRSHTVAPKGPGQGP